MKHLFTIILLSVYALFTLGFVFEWTHQTDVSHLTVPYSIAMANKRTDVAGYFTDNDAQLVQRMKAQDVKPVYADQSGVLLLQEYFGPTTDIRLATDIPVGGYLFLREWNIENGKMTFWTSPGFRRYEAIPNLDGYDIVDFQGEAVLLKKTH
jgi:hypothetical protein